MTAAGRPPDAGPRPRCSSRWIASTSCRAASSSSSCRSSNRCWHRRRGKPISNTANDKARSAGLVVLAYGSAGWRVRRTCPAGSMLAGQGMYISMQLTPLHLHHPNAPWLRYNDVLQYPVDKALPVKQIHSFRMPGQIAHVCPNNIKSLSLGELKALHIHPHQCR